MTNIVSDLEAAVEQKLAAASAALYGTSPQSPSRSKQRISMNAVTHGLTGQNVFLTEEELPAYLQLGADYIEELRPVGTREVQLAQKIIDTNWRLNRIAAIENNMLNAALLQCVLDGRTPDDRLEAMLAQSDGFRGDCGGPNAFDKLGRYEARLSRTLLRMTAELERVQAVRLNAKRDTFVLAESQAWLWYTTTLAAVKTLAEARQLTTARSTDSSENPFGKKDRAATSNGADAPPAKPAPPNPKPPERFKRSAGA